MIEKLNFKEVLVIIGVSLLITPLVYLIVNAPPGWWMK